MKAGLVSCLLPLAAMAAIVPRQSLGGALSSFLPRLDDMVPYKVIQGESDMKLPGSKNMKIIYGPFPILPADEAKKQGGWIKQDSSSNTYNRIAKGLPQDAFVLRAETKLEFMNGTEAGIGNGIYDHHVLFIDTAKTSTSPFKCENSWMPASFGTLPVSTYAGTSSEKGASMFSTRDGDFKAGYRLSSSSRMMMVMELINYGNETQDIYVSHNIDYVDGSTPDMRDTHIGILSVAQCDSNSVNIAVPVDKKQFNYMSKPLVATQNGYLLVRRGHTHDGGEAVIMSINDKVVCDSQAKYGGQGQTWGTKDGDWDMLSEMGECYDPIRVTKGDLVTLEAKFDVGKHPLRQHAHGGEAEIMGLMSIAFAADGTGNNKDGK